MYIRRSKNCLNQIVTLLYSGSQHELLHPTRASSMDNEITINLAPPREAKENGLEIVDFTPIQCFVRAQDAFNFANKL